MDRGYGTFKQKQAVWRSTPKQDTAVPDETFSSPTKAVPTALPRGIQAEWDPQWPLL